MAICNQAPFKIFTLIPTAYPKPIFRCNLSLPSRHSLLTTDLNRFTHLSRPSRPPRWPISAPVSTSSDAPSTDSATSSPSPSTPKSSQEKSPSPRSPATTTRRS